MKLGNDKAKESNNLINQKLVLNKRKKMKFMKGRNEYMHPDTAIHQYS